MRLLLIHQNFPAQFRHLTRELVDRGHELVALGRRTEGVMPAGITYGLYGIEEPAADFPGSDLALEQALRRAQQVRLGCLRLREEGWHPDAVLFHSSWGEGLYLRDVWPDQRLVGYPELYGSAWVMGHGFDQSLPGPPDDLRLVRHLNLLALAAIADCDALVCPTRYQRDSFPAHLRSRFHVIHEGIDVEALTPYRQRCVVLGPELSLRHGDPVITFCSRHLEPLRGLPTFLRAIALLHRRHPTARAVLVGENDRGYGPASTHSQGHLGALLEELEGQLDRDRLHVLGRVAHRQLIGLFQVSAAHVHLTYPYTLSWSPLEAMACGAPLVGSRGLPVEEVIADGENGLLVDFNRPEELCQALLLLLNDPPLRERLGREGRRTVERRYRLGDCADAYEALLFSEATSPARP